MGELSSVCETERASQLVRDSGFPGMKVLEFAFDSRDTGSASGDLNHPMQDWLGLDNSARINQPSTVGQNWRWRLKKTQLTKKLQKEICLLTTRYGRKNWA